MSSLTIKTAPTVEPVTLAEAQAHLRVDSNDDDSLIEGLIVAARQYCERVQGRAYITRTYEYIVEAASSVELPMPNHQEVTAVAAIDEDGIETALSTDDYSVDFDRLCALVTINSYPAGTVKLKIEYKAGYGDTAADVPQAIKQMLLLLIGFWYERREAGEGNTPVRELPFAVSSLMSIDRVNWGA